MTHTYRHGHFIWHELMAKDPAAAEKFYFELLGWSFEHVDMPGIGIYRLATAAGKQQAGIVGMPPDMEVPCAWSGYVSVADVDASANAATGAGGTVVWGPQDIEGIGRAACILDPEGAAFYVMRDANGDAPRDGQPKPAEFCWDTLTVDDGERALAFYGEVVGWTRGKFGDAPGIFFGVGDVVVADVEKRQAPSPAHWLSHVVVPELAGARTKAESLGATVLLAEIKIPNVGTMCIIADPQGAVLSLFEPAAQG